MFELVFSDSVKGSMRAAGLKGEDVESLWLALDIGDISALPDIECRKSVICSMLAGPENTKDDASNDMLWASNIRALKRVAEAGRNNEDVRIWWSDCPEETCGYYFAVSLLEKADVRVTSVKLPPYFEEGENICTHDSLKSVTPQRLMSLMPLERNVNPALRRAIARRWNELTGENAPLRAVVNGRLLSAPEDFYDYTLKKHIPEGVISVAYVIGKTLGESELGVSDWQYAQRIRRMIEAGELEIAEPDRDFYITSIRKKAR